MFQFHWYGLIIGVGILAALQASTWLAKRRRIEEEVIWKVAWWVLIGGLIGARIYHVLDLWNEIYSLNPISAFYVWNGGLGIIGGLIGGIIGLALYFRFQTSNFRLKHSFQHLVDIAFFGLPLAQVIGRIGNFINQEVYGMPTDLPWGIYIEPKNRLSGYEQFSWFHPLFAYEALWILLGFGLMFLAEKTNKLGWIKRSFTGFYLVWYGMGRFWLDFLRPAEFVWQLNLPSGTELNMAQASSGLMVVLGWLLMIKLNPFFE